MGAAMRRKIMVQVCVVVCGEWEWVLCDERVQREKVSPGVCDAWVWAAGAWVNEWRDEGVFVGVVCGVVYARENEGVRG